MRLASSGVPAVEGGGGGGGGGSPGRGMLHLRTQSVGIDAHERIHRELSLFCVGFEVKALRQQRLQHSDGLISCGVRARSRVEIESRVGQLRRDDQLVVAKAVGHLNQFP